MFGSAPAKPDIMNRKNNRECGSDFHELPVHGKNSRRGHIPRKGLKNSPVRYTRSTGYRLHWDAPPGSGSHRQESAPDRPVSDRIPGPPPGSLPFRSGKSTICESHDSDRYIPARADLQDKKAGTDCSDIRFSDKYLA